MRLVKKDFLVNSIYNTAVTYPSPANLTYFWNFGIYAMVCLGIQILTGILLAMHYTPNIDLAFISVEHIMRDVNNLVITLCSFKWCFYVFYSCIFAYF